MRAQVIGGWRLRATVCAAGIVAGILAIPIVVVAEAPSRRPQPAEPAQRAEPPARPVPLMGVFMLAYESAITGEEGTNPELVEAMKKALQENPRAGQTLAKLLEAYKALPRQQREALVGKRLASATPASAVPFDLVKQRAARQKTKNTRSVARRGKNRQGNEDSYTYPLLFKGFDCHGSGMDTDDEVSWIPDSGGSDPSYDWKHFCEPYFIFVVTYQNVTRVHLRGPYRRIEAVGSVGQRYTLAGPSFVDDGQVVVTCACYECDCGDPRDFVDRLRSLIQLVLPDNSPASDEWASHENMPLLINIAHSIESLCDDYVPHFSPDDSITQTFMYDLAEAQELGNTYDLYNGFRCDKKYVRRFISDDFHFAIYLDIAKYNPGD